MPKFSLVPFAPEQKCPIEIEVELNITDESIFISFRIDKNLELVDLGDPSPEKTRRIKLWEKTCFELFIKNEKGQYFEFNFSPKFEWNCFYFNKKGDELKEYLEMQRPKTDILLSFNEFLLIANIKKEYFKNDFFKTGKEFSAGISAVIKDKSQGLSYWALSHADNRPNFHHFDSFKYKF